MFRMREVIDLLYLVKPYFGDNSDSYNLLGNFVVLHSILSASHIITYLIHIL